MFGEVLYVGITEHPGDLLPTVIEICTQYLCQKRPWKPSRCDYEGYPIAMLTVKLCPPRPHSHRAAPQVDRCSVDWLCVVTSGCVWLQVAARVQPLALRVDRVVLHLYHKIHRFQHTIHRFSRNPSLLARCSGYCTQMKRFSTYAVLACKITIMKNLPLFRIIRGNGSWTVEPSADNTIGGSFTSKKW